MPLDLSHSLQGIHTLYRIFEQCNVNVFLMDWEKSRGKLLNGNNDEQERPAPVSLWRLVVLTNEYCDLQVCFCRGIRMLTLKDLSTCQPGIHSAICILYSSRPWCSKCCSPCPLDISDGGRHGESVPSSRHQCVYMGVCFGCSGTFLIEFYRVLIHDRHFGHKLYNFVDMLSMANISFFLLDERFHGFYVHGRSVHPHADTDMQEMSVNLKREEVFDRKEQVL